MSVENRIRGSKRVISRRVVSRIQVIDGYIFSVDLSFENSAYVFAVFIPARAAERRSEKDAVLLIWFERIGY